MTPDEIAGFQAKFCYKPTAVLVAIDALAIYVHEDNPLQCMSMEQRERVFAADPNVYLLKDPKKPIDTLSGEFVRSVISRDGQGTKPLSR